MYQPVSVLQWLSYWWEKADRYWVRISVLGQDRNWLLFFSNDDDDDNNNNSHNLSSSNSKLLLLLLLFYLKKLLFVVLTIVVLVVFIRFIKKILLIKINYTFHSWLCGVRHMVKKHSNIKRWNLLPPLLFPISSKISFICYPANRLVYNMTLITPVVEHWQEGEIAQWICQIRLIHWSITPW